MGPLSAVAIAVWLIIYGLTEVTWITASPKALGVIALIAAIIVLLDAFWSRGSHWLGNRQPQQR